MGYETKQYGLKSGRDLRFREAIDSVPYLDFNEQGVATLENPTPQQLTGLRAKAGMPDQKTGESPVWTVVKDKNLVTIIHNRRNASYRERNEQRQEIEQQRQEVEQQRQQDWEDRRRCYNLVGYVQFYGRFAEYHCETPDHEKGLKLKAEKYDWNLHPRGKGVYHIAKQMRQAS